MPTWKKKLVAIAAGAMLFSLLMGAGGGFLAGTLLDSRSSASVSQSGSVQYQSVIRTAQVGNVSAELSTADIAALAADAVVEITTGTSGRMGQYVTEGAGSGVIITEGGYIVTNNHVVEGANQIHVRTKSGESYTAKLIGTDKENDLAVLKIEATGLTTAVFGDSSSLKVGEKAVAIGNPLGELGGTVTEGIVSALDRDIVIDGESMKLLQTSAAINPGNSGGGLFNSAGELIGIVNAKSSGTGIEGLGFAIPANLVKDIAPQLIENGYVKGRVELGAELVEINDIQTAMMYRVQQLGVYVLRTTTQSSDLKSGDRIISANGKEILQNSDINSILSTLSVGDNIKLVVSRDNQVIELNISLPEKTN
jgi:serine protease Do